MSDTINLNNKDVAFTLIEQVGDIKKIMQFRDMEDYRAYREIMDVMREPE